MTNPIHTLIHEHVTIMKVVDAMDVLRQGLDAGASLDAPLFREIIEFMREFADRCHHAKEEDLLFPAMVGLGVPESGCPIGGLKGEHAQGRDLVTLLEKGVDMHATDSERAREIVVEAVKGVVKLYPNHIWKEDEMVFPMAEKLFNEGQLGHLNEAFEQAEQTLGSDHHLYETFAEELGQRLAT